MIEGQNRYQRKPRKKQNWFFYERFSYFDLIIISAVIVPGMNWVLSHLHWG